MRLACSIGIAEAHWPEEAKSATVCCPLRDSTSGTWRETSTGLSTLDSIMTHRADSGDGLELLLFRECMRRWRFYDDVRTDRDAPARRPQVGTYTPVLSGDGADIGAAVQTIIEIGDADTLAEAVADAFDGATLSVGQRFEVEMHQHGLLRPLAAAELSDGTLRYLLLAAALLSPRPPELMILSEPEASLHPDLLAPLARLMLKAAERCQLVVVSHAQPLVEVLGRDPSTVLVSREATWRDDRARHGNARMAMAGPLMWGAEGDSSPFDRLFRYQSAS